jgi:hypothetical protein
VIVTHATGKVSFLQLYYGNDAVGFRDFESFTKTERSRNRMNELYKIIGIDEIHSSTLRDKVEKYCKEISLHQQRIQNDPSNIAVKHHLALVYKGLAQVLNGCEYKDKVLPILNLARNI